MLEVAPDWIIPSEEIELHFVRSSGPGGQNVNKVASKAELRFLLSASRALSPGQKRRLVAAFPSHVTLAGDFILTSDRFRSRLQNERDARERLAEMLLSVRFAPARRVPTRPSRAAKKRRVVAKRARGDTKRDRRRPDEG
ncbi:MAG: aminoacyl-tRNA hydrolase [Pseudomonadota bacterium]|jgi:ribosome-associated protein